jgi:prepilin-type N-terminal cleavage/methylation domain-containing protein/prepilin-type processing-associated H-X9-DG protein
MPFSSFPPAARMRRAFTLIELLTVIAIIGVLAAIIIPTVGRVRKSARSAQSQSNLRQLGMAFQGFAAEHKDRIPPFIADGWGSSVSDERMPAHPFRACWAWWLLPYVGMPVKDHTVAEPGLQAESVFFAPNDPYYQPRIDGLPRRTYAMPISGNPSTPALGNALKPGSPWVGPLSRLSAPSKTILLGERFAGDGTVGGPGWSDIHLDLLDKEMNRAENNAAHSPVGQPKAGVEVNGGKFNFLFADGHVQALKLEETVTFPGEFGTLANPKGLWLARGL